MPDCTCLDGRLPPESHQADTDTPTPDPDDERTWPRLPLLPLPVQMSADDFMRAWGTERLRAHLIPRSLAEAERMQQDGDTTALSRLFDAENNRT